MYISLGVNLQPRICCAGAWDVSRRCTPEENFSAIWERLRRQYLPQFLFIPVTKRAPRETWEISSEALKISTDVRTPSQQYHVQLPGAPGVVDWCSKFLSFLSYTLDFIFQCVNYRLTLVIHASPVKILKRSAATSIFLVSDARYHLKSHVRKS